MPRYSAFTPFGQLRFSSRKSHSQIFYESLFAAYGGEENFRKTGLQGARLYATAMVLGHARYTLDRAGNQFDPLKVGELLPVQEREYGIIPPKGATISERRRTLALKKAISAGSRPGNIRYVLSQLIDGFIANRVTPVAQAATFPPDVATGGTGVLYADPKVPSRTIRITSGGFPPGEQTVTYEHVAGADSFLPGQKLLVQPDHNVRREVVEITAIGDNTLTATFTETHDEGILCTTAPFFGVVSTRRRHQLLLTPDSIRDPDARRKVHQAMRELATGVTTWEMFEEVSEGTAGPFTVNGGRIGITPIGEVEF